MKQWKFIGKNSKLYDNEIKGYIHILNNGALSKMQIPNNEKISLNLMQGFITFQIYLNSTKSFTIEISISDSNNGKKRLLLSACSKEFIMNQLHCRIPIINIPTGIWINFCIDILSFVSECFKGQSFRAIDSICLSADCKVRRICGMRQLYTKSAEEYLNLGEETLLPKGFILPGDVQCVNINFDMEYIKNTVDIKNIKDNNNKENKNIPKTSQGNRRTFNSKIREKSNEKETNRNNNFKMEKDKKEFERRSKSSNKAVKPLCKGKETNINVKNKKIKNYLENDTNSNKDLRKVFSNKIGGNRIIHDKTGRAILLGKEGTNNGPQIINNNNTIKCRKQQNNFSKSLGKVKINNNNKTYNRKNSLKPTNEKNEMLTYGQNKFSGISNGLEQNNYNTKENSNINKAIENITNNEEKKLKQKKECKNIGIHIKNKKEEPLFNTFNYKDIESKENTLIINQSNFNSPSIPEMVDLDINNTYLKNIENDINENGIIYLEKQEIKDEPKRTNDNSTIKNEQVESILVFEGLIPEITEEKNERPYTPPMLKIIPVNEDKNSINNKINNNNMNISKVNESIIQNHYCDLVYDNETGRYYDSKTKVFYDFK